MSGTAKSVPLESIWIYAFTDRKGQAAGVNLPNMPCPRRNNKRFDVGFSSNTGYNEWKDVVVTTIDDFKSILALESYSEVFGTQIPASS